MDPDQTARSSLIRVHTVCMYSKNRFEKFARIFSRRHKQTTFSGAGFFGILRVKELKLFVIFTREITFVSSCLFFYLSNPFRNGLL